MEDVCEISTLLQEEHAERDMQEKEMLTLESGINIEENRYKQEKSCLRDMIQNRERVKSQAMQTSDMLDIVLSRLDENLHPCVCDDVKSVVIPRIEGHCSLKDKVLLANEEILGDINQLEHDISVCEENIASGLLHEAEAVETQLAKKRKLLDMLGNSVQETHMRMEEMSRQHHANETVVSAEDERRLTAVCNLRRSENKLLRLDENIEGLQTALSDSLKKLSTLKEDVQLRKNAIRKDSSEMQLQIDEKKVDLLSTTNSLASVTAEFKETNDRVEILKVRNAEIITNLSGIRECIHTEEAAIRSARGTLEIVKNRINAQFKIARAFCENITLSSNSEKNEADNLELRENVTRLGLMLKDLEDQELSLEISSIVDSIIACAVQSAAEDGENSSLRDAITSVKSCIASINTTKEANQEALDAIQCKLADTRSRCDMLRSTLNGMKCEEDKLCADTGAVREAAEAMHSLEERVALQASQIKATADELTKVVELKESAQRCHEKMKKTVTATFVSSEIERRAEKKKQAARAQWSSAIKSLRSEMKRADAEFKKDVKATNDSHKQKVELLREELRNQESLL